MRANVVSLIESTRLLLRPHSLDELGGYAELWSTATEIPGLPKIPPLSQEEIWARLLRFIGHWSVFGFGPFIVVDKATETVVGEVGLAHFHRGNGDSFDSSPEAMWKIDRRYQGRGFASEAVQMAFDWFDEQRIANRTVCMIDPQNSASLRIAEHFGFHKFASAVYRSNPVLLFERKAG
ncbi:GNAT family N-acetyltransferase [Ochrobactrum sp. GPK 3]|uniref:GNAT family N-acetyltransferase n=1 Tax=Brucella sp. 22210 TaxID=3453892 RepID=UPI0031385EE9